MASYNKVILMGNLTRDPELRYTNSQMAVCQVGLAVNRRFKDGQSGEWKEAPTFVDVTIFGARGEAFSRYHSKGKPAFVEGSLRMDTWDDKNTGAKRSKLYVVADNWEFVGAGRGESGDAAGGYGGGGGGAGAGGGDYGDEGGSYGHRAAGADAGVAPDDTPF